MEATEGAMEEAVAMEVVVAVEAVADVEDSENIYPYKTIQDLNTASKKILILNNGFIYDTFMDTILTHF